MPHFRAHQRKCSDRTRRVVQTVPGILELLGFAQESSVVVEDSSSNNQYEFELAIQDLLHRAHEGHLSLSTPAYTAFAFAGPWEFVAISSNGTALPEIYDVLPSELEGGDWEPSPITQVNGQSAEEYFTNYARSYAPGLIEPNADWNGVLANAVHTDGGAPSSPIRLSVNYSGSDFMNLTFSNNSSASGIWSTTTQYNCTSVETSDDFYDLVIAPQEITTSSGSGKSSLGPTNITETLPELGLPYPSLVVVQQGLGYGGFVSGYFLNESSIAVLSITSFLMRGPLAQSFIDLQGNGGGTVILGVDLFKQLFPAIEPYVGSRMRAHSSWISWEILSNIEIRNNLADYGFIIRHWWIWVDKISLVGQTVTILRAKWRFLRQHRELPLSISFHTLTFSGTLQLQRRRHHPPTIRKRHHHVSGYANESDIAPRYFAPQDILLLTGGSCASTYAAFIEQMRTQASVRTVVVCGLPSIGPMQAVAGTKSALRYDAAAISSIAAYSLLLNSSIEFESLPSIFAPPMNIDLSTVAFNFRGQVRVEEQGVPLQMVYELEDCRIWYTSEMVVDYRMLWQMATNALWEDRSLCV
ncbi:uncharacterized protein PAC_05737 [Phialocephala subalpina]|uniref:CPAF-like PDZ domain-containing protein n=1 Tax=Phialocephala subalpina TaxID=576137 RepID=A0A1L7WSU9_9HELO|nr:uncharacterized protein PAC_05737 [Phialocephala subalpina]